MERVVIDDLSPSAALDVDRRGLSGPLDTSDVALNRYRIPPGEGFLSGLHTHADQEEIFLVVDGTATFETLPESDPPSDPADPPRTGREVTVDAGEAVRFAPGEYQSGYNRGETDLLAFAVGAPRESTDVRVPVRCPECGGADLGLDTGGDALSFVCPDCGAERIPAPCPECGSDSMTLTLDGDRTVVSACERCGSAFRTPPYRD
ncbi:cupin domain-containing protein [Halosimplex aquaticum]|uniref:Cupin domain-containing protein n=1 Tax=Halosimplex aquaticum TaxID=3026162 RepID=A0ABD5Y978_9EURY|nr:cupin domain-containing protein [Halosimplex aquaticum]